MSASPKATELLCGSEGQTEMMAVAMLPSGRCCRKSIQDRTVELNFEIIESGHSFLRIKIAYLRLILNRYCAVVFRKTLFRQHRSITSLPSKDRIGIAISLPWPLF